MQIHRKGQVILDVAEHVKTVENEQQLAHQLGKAVMSAEYPTSRDLGQFVRFGFGEDTRQLTAQLNYSAPAVRDVADLVIRTIGDETPAIISLWKRLPSLAWALRQDDVVVLDEAEARALRWLGLAVGIDVR